MIILFACLGDVRALNLLTASEIKADAFLYDQAIGSK